jgi:DNA-binding CsgD family transcriptional regulator
MKFDAFERAGRDEAEAATRAVLGEEAFASAYTAGRTLTRDAWGAAADDIVSVLEAGESPGENQRGWAVAGLTPRERDILLLVAEGRSDREVAEVLFITQGTVRTHLTNIFGKLAVGSRTAAVAAARRLGIL